MSTPAEHATTVREASDVSVSPRATEALNALVALADRATELERERGELREVIDAKTVEWHHLYSDMRAAEARAEQLEKALRPLRLLFAELDDYTLSLTDERIDELRDAIVEVARAALDGGTATPATAICPECAAGNHVTCLDDGSSTWTDRCKCGCGDYPKPRLVGGTATPRPFIGRIDSGGTATPEGEA